MGDAGLLRIAPPRLPGLEHGPGDVPLQQVDGATAGVGQVGELADQQALAGAGQPGEEDQPRVAGQRREQRRRLLDQHGAILAPLSLVNENVVGTAT